MFSYPFVLTQILFSIFQQFTDADSTSESLNSQNFDDTVATTITPLKEIQHFKEKLSTLKTIQKGNTMQGVARFSDFIRYFKILHLLRNDWSFPICRYKVGEHRMSRYSRRKFDRKPVIHQSSSFQA